MEGHRNITTEKERLELETARANHLTSLIKLCKTIWEDECMNRDCEECSIGFDKKQLKEHFNVFS
jgi:hypothetical protein